MTIAELNRKYELVVVVDAKLTGEEKEAILKDALDLIGKCGGRIINSQIWLEKHKFTFRINKRTEGTYYLVNFECAGAGLPEIRKEMRLKEKILRFLLVKIA
ncbi:MAG: 30S ribosomal protein S6 [Candidatus Omnitrophica bacterium]|nr:30S ribosomal protein S6 [Candidatus Omnitrophota bacterium]